MLYPFRNTYSIKLYGNYFFIQYIPNNTIRSRWYFIQVLLVVEPLSDNKSLTTRMYSVLFLSRHTANPFLTDNLERWSQK